MKGNDFKFTNNFEIIINEINARSRLTQAEQIKITAPGFQKRSKFQPQSDILRHFLKTEREIFTSRTTPRISIWRLRKQRRV